MILLDTNIISELWRVEPSRNVERWMDSQPTTTLFISAITLGELNYGAMRLPFDRHCSRAYGQIRAKRERLGRPILSADAAIAAIAKTHGLTLATRNLKDFEALDIELINPFEPVL